MLGHACDDAPEFASANNSLVAQTNLVIAYAVCCDVKVDAAKEGACE